MHKVMVIGIAGGTGSGKTTITKRIMKEFGGIAEENGYSLDVIGAAECIITKKMFTENGSILSDIYNVANQVACLNGTYEGYRID